MCQKGYKMLKCTNAEEREINQNHCKKCDQNLEERNSDIFSPSLCSNTAEVKKIVLFKHKCYCLILAQYNVSIKWTSSGFSCYSYMTLGCCRAPLSSPDQILSGLGRWSSTWPSPPRPPGTGQGSTRGTADTRWPRPRNSRTPGPGKMLVITLHQTNSDRHLTAEVVHDISPDGFRIGDQTKGALL